MQSNLPQYAEIVNLVSKACPKYLLDGSPITDLMYYGLGILPPAIDKALALGKTVQQIAAQLENMVRQEGWTHAIGEFSDTDLLSGLGIVFKSRTPVPPWPNAAEAKKLASNGANVDNAVRGQAFNGVDGIVVRLAPGATPDNPDSNYVAARALLLAAYPPTPTPAPAPGPVGPDGQPTGLPGIEGN